MARDPHGEAPVIHTTGRLAHQQTPNRLDGLTKPLGSVNPAAQGR
jgi:hypothetical protein